MFSRSSQKYMNVLQEEKNPNACNIQYIWLVPGDNCKNNTEDWILENGLLISQYLLWDREGLCMVNYSTAPSVSASLSCLFLSGWLCKTVMERDSNK